MQYGICFGKVMLNYYRQMITFSKIKVLCSNNYILYIQVFESTTNEEMNKISNY